MEHLFLETNFLGFKRSLFTSVIVKHIFISSFSVKSVGNNSKAQENVLKMILCYPYYIIAISDGLKVDKTLKYRPAK